MPNAGPKKLSRRDFMKGAAAAAAGLAAPYAITSAALGTPTRAPASERIVLGAIGLGGRGTGVLGWMLNESDVQFVAICDIRRQRREAIKEMADNKYANTDCAMYRDLREFLPARPDIDALLIATGERWHALASTLAMQAGKDVYCEKPGSMTVSEGQGLVNAWRRYRRVFQTGTQRRSEANFIFANELVRLGRLGKVHTVRAHIASWNPTLSHEWLPAEPEPPRDEVDWDLWLGMCPWRPYNKSYVSGGWRGFYDYHTGDVGEWGSHTFCQCQGAIDCDHTSAVEYIHPGNNHGEGLIARFANGVDMVLQRKGWRGSCGVRYEGTDGWVAVADGYGAPDVSNPALLADFKRIVADYQARTQRPTNHVRDFFNCVKTRRLTVSNAQVSHRSMTTVHASNICLWVGRNLKWDPVKEEFPNDPEANRYLVRALREPWRA